MDTESIARIAGYVVFVAFFLALLALLITEWNNASFRQLVTDQIRVFVLLPAAGLFAFLIVSVFEQTSGPIKFSGVGFSFEGASGRIVLWVLCFLAIVIAISALWNRPVPASHRSG
jgi:hypothetical protein